MVTFGGVTPILRISSMPASLDFYVNVLGFTVNWQYPYFASVSRGKCNLFLSKGDQGHPGAWVWIGINDADAFHQELLDKGAKVRHPPTNYAWALEMQVEDPDGNILRLGSDPREGEPIGEWLDMNGARWLRAEDGEWRKA
jgi:catechol 2,3-dioxygenase-like lactoylglutathione lyase family enzyme